MSSTDDSSILGRLSGARPRALLVIAALAVVVAAGDLTRPVLAVALLMGAMAVAVLVDPEIRRSWAFNVAVGAAVALYGLAYALGRTTVVGRVIAAGIVVLGLLVAANYLGIVPWSDHPRRV